MTWRVGAEKPFKVKVKCIMVEEGGMMIMIQKLQYNQVKDMITISQAHLCMVDYIIRDVIIVELEDMLNEGEKGSKRKIKTIEKGIEGEEMEINLGIIIIKVAEEVTPVTAMAPVMMTGEMIDEEGNEEEDGAMKKEEIEDLQWIDSLDWQMIYMESNLNKLVTMY